MRVQDNRGYTLIELVVVMAIFSVVMMVTSSAFKTVLSQVGQQSKSIETQIGSLVGLEMLRSDLQDAGFGLPWAFQSAPAAAEYTEITASDSTMPAALWPTGMSPRTFNDATGNVPRAVQSGNTAFNQDSASPALGSQYLVIKSMSAAPGATQKKWINVAYSDTGKTQSDWGGAADRDFVDEDRVIVVRNTFVDGVPSRRLAVNDGVFSSTFDEYTTLTLPHSAGDLFQVYGVDPGTDPRMPFNRADYYVSRPDKPPPACAPNTGILYKAVANQSAGFRVLPLLDCVADMQVVYGMGPVGSTEVNQHQPTLAATLSARDIREQLKEIRVYILAHEGKKDTGFSFPNQLVTVGEEFAGVLNGRNFNLAEHIGPDVWKNYRWKVYTIVVRPKNLIQ